MADSSVFDARGPAASDADSDDRHDVHEAALAELRSPNPPSAAWDTPLAALDAALRRAVTRTLRPSSDGDAPTARSRTLGLVAVAVSAIVALGAWTMLRRPPDPTAALPRDPAVASGNATGAGSTVPDAGAGAQKGTAANTVVDPATATTVGSVVVHVAGAVHQPGVVTLPAGSRTIDAVDAAGGFVPGADPDRVNLAAPLIDGSRLVVPLVGQVAPVELVPDAGGTQGGGATARSADRTGSPPSSAAPVDLNTADAAALDALPGVGPATAAAIISHRDEHGPFSSVEDLLDVRGIGEAKLDALRDLVTVGP